MNVTSITQRYRYAIFAFRRSEESMECLNVRYGIKIFQAVKTDEEVASQYIFITNVYDEIQQSHFANISKTMAERYEKIARRKNC